MRPRLIIAPPANPNDRLVLGFNAEAKDAVKVAGELAVFGVNTSHRLGFVIAELDGNAVAQDPIANPVFAHGSPATKPLVTAILRCSTMTTSFGGRHDSWGV